MMTRLRTLATVALIAGSTGQSVQAIDDDVVLPVRKQKPPAESPAPEAGEKKKAESSAAPKKALSVRRSADKTGDKTGSGKKSASSKPAASARPSRTPRPAEDEKPKTAEEREDRIPEDALAAADSSENEGAEESTPAEMLMEEPAPERLPVTTLPPRRAEPTPGLVSRAFSRVLPSKKPEPVSFNTDYKTRSSGSVIPVAIAGKGFGGRDLPIGAEDTFRTSLPADFCPTDLLRIPPELCAFSSQPIFLRQEAAVSLERMFRDAAAQGLNLKIFSGYRDYSHQARLYADAVKKRGANQKTVARPGRSEHFLGTTADVTNGQPQHLLSRTFADSPEGKWLMSNGQRYGWKMTVRAVNNGRSSHNDEPWHIRYLGNGTGSPQQPRQPAKPSLVKRLGRFIGLGK